MPGATEGGYLRWLTSWVGGPEGHINPNFGVSVTSDKTSVGFMKLMKGCRQKGVHAHTIVEVRPSLPCPEPPRPTPARPLTDRRQIYVILKGNIEGFDGKGHKHRAGPMDCIYIPKGVPHAVRNSGVEDLDLLWIHDGIEKKGAATYYFDEATTPKIGGVQVIKFMDLEPQWAAPKASQAPFLRYLVSWVGGQGGVVNYNPKEAHDSDKVALGMLVIYPGNRQVSHSYPGNRTYVVVEGKALVDRGKGKEEVKRLDGIWIPGGTKIALSNHATDGSALWVLWTHERPLKADSYSIEE